PEWVDWFNHRRLLEPIGNIPPAEAEDRYYGHCQVEALQQRLGGMGLRSHPAMVAVRHCAAASDRKMRSVDRETRWRWRLKVLWTAACTLRKRCADAVDLKRCILRSRRRTT